ncbi:MAG TPA: hypothetical protein VF139_11870 [Candidatus Polarisedimenticolaceae bacterium]
MRRTIPILVVAAAALSCGRSAAPPTAVEGLPVLLEFYSDT